jgi:hypothetical protein
MTDDYSSRYCETALRNAAVWTADRAHPWAEAIAIRDGKICAIGRNADVEALIGPWTQVIDLRGKMVMPGINDVHVHALMGGRADLYECNFLPTASFDEILRTVDTHAAKTADGKWIAGGIWGSDLLGKLSSLEARRALDGVSHGHPVILSDDTRHNRWANTRALEAANMTADTPGPPDGEIVKETQGGEPTGVLLEAAGQSVDAAAFAAQENRVEYDLAAARRAVEILNRHGVTAFQEAGTSLSVLAAFRGLDDRGELSARVVGSLPLNGSIFAGDVIGEELIAKREGYRSAHVRPDFVKIFLDGVPPSRTAAFLEPYLPDESHGYGFRGKAKLSLVELTLLMAKYERAGLPTKIHATGDGSVREVLDAIELIRHFHGADGPAHHLAHASFIDPADIARFKALNVVADLSPSLWYPGPILEATKLAIGEQRALRFWPNRDLYESGALLAAGSDWPVMPSPTPWNGIEGMITRRDPSGAFQGALWPEQALDLTAVLEIYTINAARAMGIDHLTGALGVGRSADLIVLDRNLFQIPPGDISGTRVLMTVFEGRIVQAAEVSFASGAGQ